MRNPDICKPLLEEILQIKIHSVFYSDYEKSIDITYNNRGIRLDIYVEDDNHTVYNLEMQVENYNYLPQRSRYYQGLIDLNLLEKGQDYDKLNLMENLPTVNLR